MDDVILVGGPSQRMGVDKSGCASEADLPWCTGFYKTACQGTGPVFLLLHLVALSSLR